MIFDNIKQSVVSRITEKKTLSSFGACEGFKFLKTERAGQGVKVWSKVGKRTINAFRNGTVGNEIHSSNIFFANLFKIHYFTELEIK
jgi:hypothetical protein